MITAKRSVDPGSVDELEFLQDGKRIAEVDLIGYTDDTLLVAECKSTSSLAGSNAAVQGEVNKKCRIAKVTRADQLIFATTATSWDDRAQRLIQAAVRTHVWGPLGPPDVKLIAGLS